MHEEVELDALSAVIHDAYTAPKMMPPKVTPNFVASDPTYDHEAAYQTCIDAYSAAVDLRCVDSFVRPRCRVAMIAPVARAARGRQRAGGGHGRAGGVARDDGGGRGADDGHRRRARDRRHVDAARGDVGRDEDVDVVAARHRRRAARRD